LGAPYEVFEAAGEKPIHNIIQYARRRGMQCSLVALPTESPPVVKLLLKGAEPIHQLQKLEIVPGPDTPIDDPGLMKLSTAIVQSSVNTYLKADSLVIWNF
jgi:hypothetical protein